MAILIKNLIETRWVAASKRSIISFFSFNSQKCQSSINRNVLQKVDTVGM